MPSPISARDLIESSLRMIGVLASGENATGDEITDGLASLNDVIENLSLESLSVYGSNEQTFPLVVNQAVYTIGAGGNFNVVRPVRVTSGRITLSGVDYDLTPWEKEDYDLVAFKANGGIPEYFAYENDFPLGQIYLYPTPSQAMTITLDLATVLSAVALPTTTISLPPGYSKMLRALLAVEMSPEYGRPVTETVQKLAQEAKADVKRSNHKAAYARFDAGIASYGDYFVRG